MATHSGILAWKIPWTEEPGRLQSMALQRVRHDWAHTHTHTHTHKGIYRQIINIFIFHPVEKKFLLLWNFVFYLYWLRELKINFHFSSVCLQKFDSFVKFWEFISFRASSWIWCMNKGVVSMAIALDKLIPRNYWLLPLDKHQDSENKHILCVGTYEIRTLQDLRADQKSFSSFTDSFIHKHVLSKLPRKR